MKAPISLSDLSYERILKLQAEYEGTIIFPNVTSKDLHGWKERYPQVVESTKVRLEYNFLRGSLVIQCNPMLTHDSLQSFFNMTVITSLLEKLGRSQTKGLVWVASGTSK